MNILARARAHETDFEEKVASILIDLDISWREAKRELDRISSEIMDLKRTLTSTLDTTYKLSRNVREKAVKYRGRYQEILTRIEGDLISTDDLLSTIRENCESLSNALESHWRFPSMNDINGIKFKIANLKDEVQRKRQALDQLSEDLISYLRGEKKYSDYGYSTNPFVFTVPPEYPTEIVDQEKVQEKLGFFVNDMLKGSSRNILFLVADEGMGKTHTLNYFAKRLNEGVFGNALALRLNCKPRSDIIDLYPQIYSSMSRIPASKVLSEEVLRILESSGVPKGITDFLGILRTINSYLIEKGCKGVFLLIDDFENTLPSIETKTTPRSILQLGDLVKLENMGFIIAIREKSWKEWSGQIGKRVKAVGKINVVGLEKFTARSTLQLINYRLSEYRDLEAKKAALTFSLEIARQICKIAQGIPRVIIQIAREVFRIAVSENRKITLEVLKEATSQ
jgi:Cdc6-like AAA superfamily ATPase